MTISKFNILFSLLVVITFTSCATATFSKFKGLGRIKKYNIYSKNLPDEFNGLKIAFASDFHYKSKLTHKRLANVVRALNSVLPDVVILGGDYPGNSVVADMDTLFTYISKVNSRYGTYAVMGNHDTGTFYEDIKRCMKENGITLLEDNSVTLYNGNSHIIVAGVKNSFDTSNNISISQNFDKDEYIILVSHSPDYAENKDVSNADLVLSGHTHGGQITIFKNIAPVTNSKYGTTFLKGLKYNSKGVPVLITNGLGTSRKNIRLFTPSEIVLLTLYKE